MPGIRFLERLQAQNRDPDWRKGDSVNEVLQSICGYLSKLLNTRQGSTLIDPDFGIPDFTGAGVSFTRQDIPHLEQRIAAFITRYEPRLTDVQIRFSSEEVPFQMVFSLQAELRTGSSAGLPIRLITRVSHQGKVTVSP